MDELEDSQQLTARTFPHWKRGKILGRGAHGTVYLGRIEKNGQYIAVKTVHTEGMNNADLDAIEHEIRMIRSLQHTNIVRYLGTEKRRHTLNIFLEYAAGGCLRQLLQEHGRLSEETTALFSTQILRGLDYLHSNGIAHRDIKGANVLLAAEGHCKLADFGASKRVEANSLVSGLKGTPHWMAPEVIKGQQTPHGWIKADIWSIGCTVIEMLTGKMPWPMFPNPMAAMYHIANGERPPIEGITISDDADTFISACCQQDPLNRSTTKVLLKEPFLKRREDAGPPRILSKKEKRASKGNKHTPVDSESPQKPARKKEKMREKDTDDQLTPRHSFVQSPPKKAEFSPYSPVISSPQGVEPLLPPPIPQERPKERSQQRRSMEPYENGTDASPSKTHKSSRPKAAASSEIMGLKQRYAIDRTITLNTSAAIRREALLQLSSEEEFHVDRPRHSKSAGVIGGLSPLNVGKRLPPLMSASCSAKSTHNGAGPIIPMLPLRSIASAPSNVHLNINASLPQLPLIRGGQSDSAHPLRRSNPM